MANERILISFQRTVISKTTSEYLCSKLDKDEDAEMINNIKLLQTGLKKKLKTVEVNALMFKLLCSILVNDNLEESLANENIDPEEISKNSTVDTDSDEENYDTEKTEEGDKTIARGLSVPTVTYIEFNN